MVNNKWKKAKQLITFGVIGGIGAVVNTAILFLLTSYASMNYLLASVIATEVAIMSNFAGNNLITFKNEAKKSKTLNKFGKFQMISIITVLGTVGILWLLTETLGKKYLLIWNLAAIIIMFVANFVLNKKYTWNSKTTKILMMTIMSIALITSIASASMTATSQLGYHPSSHKQVVVYTNNNSGNFTIYDSNNQATTTLALTQPLNSSGTGIVTCQGNQSCLVGDFTNLTSSGTYHIQSNVAGSTATTYNFEISNNLYSDNIDTMLEFYDAMAQQNSSYHSDMHKALQPPFLMTADGSFLLTTNDAAIGLIRMSYAYNKNPDLFTNTNNHDLNKANTPDMVEYMKLYAEYLRGMQGLNVTELTNGTGFRVNPAVEITDAFVPGSTNITNITIYTNDTGGVLKTVSVTSLCANAPNVNQCLTDAANYYKCQTNEVCLNGTYQEKTGIINSNNNGYGVGGGWEYEFGCYFDVDNNNGIFNNEQNPCMILKYQESAENTAKTFFAYLNAMPAINDYYPSDSQEYFNRAVNTYYHLKNHYSSELNDDEVAPYYGSGLFRLYDYTNNVTYLQEAYNMRGSISTDFDLWKTHGNEFYWYEYAKHKEAIENDGLTYDISGTTPTDLFNNKLFGEWKDDFLAMSKNGERVLEKHRDFNFANSRSMIITSVYAMRAIEMDEKNNQTVQEFFRIIPENQLAWLTGMNAVQNGTSSNQSMDSISFIVGLGTKYPQEIHSRYLMSTGYSATSGGAIIGARGTGLLYQTNNGYEYFDGKFSILGKTLGAMGNGVNGEAKISEFNNTNTFTNGGVTIPGWINGAFDDRTDTDVFFNYDDTRYTYEYTETTQETVASMLELFSYLDAEQNNRSEHASITFNYTATQTTTNQTNSSSGNSSTGNSTGATNTTTGNLTNITNSTITNITNGTAGNNSTNNSTGATNVTNSTGNSSSQIVVTSQSTAHNILENEEETFSISLNGDYKVEWYFDDQLVKTELNGQQHNLSVTPTILYTSNVKTANVEAMIDGGRMNKTWNFDVTNVLNPFFDPVSGNDNSVAHVFTNDNTGTYDNVNISIKSREGSNDVIKNYVLVSGGAGNNETDWKQTINDFNFGTNYLVKIVTTKNGVTKEYNLSTTGDIRAFEKNNPAAAQTSSGGGGGSSGGSSSSVLSTPELVYVILSSEVVGQNSSVKITLDAKGGINKATAIFENPKQEILRVPLKLTKGSTGYGTWTADINTTGLPGGLYNLRNIELSGSSTIMANVSQRSFYLISSNVEDSEKLMLVYLLLSTQRVEVVSNVTMRLDARDNNGVTKTVTNIRVTGGGYEEETFEVPLQMVSGNQKYGTWEGQFTVNRPDSTYTVEKVTFYNNETSKEYLVSNRSVYASNKLPEVPGLKRSLITGGSITEIAGILKSPIFPAILAAIIIVAGLGVTMIVQKIRKK